jgi:hypothetical protein
VKRVIRMVCCKNYVTLKNIAGDFRNPLMSFSARMTQLPYDFNLAPDDVASLFCHCAMLTCYTATVIRNNIVT